MAQDAQGDGLGAWSLSSGGGGLDEDEVAGEHSLLGRRPGQGQFLCARGVRLRCVRACVGGRTASPVLGRV